MFADLFFFFLKEEFWQASELFIIRFLQRALYQDVKEIENHRHLMPLGLINYIQTQTVLAFESKIAFFTLSI